MRFVRGGPGQDKSEVDEMFLIALAALVGVIGTLLWFTNWAEARVIQIEPETPTAETR